MSPVSAYNQENPEFPLRRIVKCGHCDNAMTAGWSKGRHARYAYYRCQKCKKATSVSADKIQNDAVGFLSTISPTKDALKAFVGLLRHTYYQRVTRLQKRKDEADGELKRLKTLRQSLIEKNLNGT